MGTVIKMSDGEEFRVNSEYDDMVNVIGGAFRRDHRATRDARGRIIQSGFLVLNDGTDQEVLINASQIVSARPALDKSHAHGAVSGRTAWSPVTAGRQEHF